MSWEDDYQVWLSYMAANNRLREAIKKEMEEERRLVDYQAKLYFHPRNRIARLLRNLAKRIEKRTVIP